MHAFSKPRFQRLCLALLAAMAMPVMPAIAQQASQQDATKQDGVKSLDRITVTGSRIKRTEVEQALPITTIEKAELDQQGITSAEQLMSYLNIAGNGSDNLASNGGIVSEEQRGNNGVSGANLRGQGADATLVLLNGRRVATHGLKGRAVDLNSIPFAAIERVEVLRDGASAIYGTDAIGGVINFITRKDFEGAQVSAFVDYTEAGGGNIQRGSILFGKGDLQTDGWNAFGTLSYRRNTILRGNDRDFSNSFQAARGLTPDTRGTPFATVFNRPTSTPSLINNGLRDPLDNSLQQAINVLNIPGGAGCETGGPNMGPYGYVVWGVPSSRYACAWDYPAAAVIQQPVDSVDFIGRATFKINESHEAYAEFTGSQVEVTKSFEPNQISPGSTFGPSTWYPLNATTKATYDGIYNALANYFGASQLNYGAPIAYRWRCMACGPRTIRTKTDAYRVLFGASGLIGSWDYDIGLSRASSKSTSTLVAGFHYTDGLQQVFGSGLINPFLKPGQSQSAAGQAALDAVSADGVVLYGGESLVTQFDASVSGDLGFFNLPGGAISMAAGVDLRREEFRFNGDERVTRRAVFNAPFDDANVLDNVSRDVNAVFAEFRLPLLKNLEVTLAGRHDRYDGFGGTTNPKASFRWQPMQSLIFRGAYSTGFKVPSFNQLFNGITETQYTGLDLADPKTCPSGVASTTVAGCASIRPTELFGGKADLTPEESSQKSLGMVFEPNDRFNASLDWWEIERNNTIRSAPREVLIKYYDLFKNNWIRDSSGEVVSIDRRYINSGGSLTRGIEVDANLRGELAGGRWTVSLNGSYLDLFKSKALESLPYSDNLVGDYVRYYNLPIKWKHTLGFAWNRGAWSHGLTQIYRAGYNDEMPPSVANGSFIPSDWDPNVDSYTLYNYNVTYSGFQGFKLAFGVKNLLDTDPPFTAHQNDFAAGAGWEARIADPRGRAYTFLVEYTF